MTLSLLERIENDHYAGYSYAYPHKTSYRKLDPTVPLNVAWKNESKDSLFLYVHIPFCEMRCGFCNLFTTVQPKEDLVKSTLEATILQSETVAGEIGPESISQLAFGGGTPSFLAAYELERLFDCLESDWKLNWNETSSSFETSPSTMSVEKLRLLQSRNIDRISMGVQSFAKSDLKMLGRPQADRDVINAIDMVRQVDFPVLNLDLIYGTEGQTLDSWNETIQRAIEISPTEIYLYPLYVRKLTGLERTGNSPGQHRGELYRMGRDALRAAGYEQISMRLFRQVDPFFKGQASDYCCQDDGMVGLGPGARSYTRSLHYSSEYAVGQQGVRGIIDEFNSNLKEGFSVADYGVWLDEEEKRRRYLIKSLLRTDGLELAGYRNRFGVEALSDFPQLNELFELGLAEKDQDLLQLTESGLSLSDVIGPWLYSRNVTSRMEQFELV